jgi:hypothetical protein
MYNTQSYQISGLQAITKCSLFQNNLNLLVVPYTVQSKVSPNDFWTFISSLEDNLIDITDMNMTGLLALCEEFGYKDLKSKLSIFEDKNKETKIIALEHWLEKRDREIAELHSTVIPLIPLDPLSSALIQRNFDSDERLNQIELLRIHISKLRSCKLMTRLVVPSINSVILSNIPIIFDDFENNKFSLLWRGSCHGFSASEFHRRCDGHSNTLIVIMDTNWNIFGGFTPIEWESLNEWKCDHTLKSFVFTVKNPHNLEPTKFDLKASMKGRAIHCMGGWNPCFGNDIVLYDRSNTHNNNWINIGSSYRNATGIDGRLIMTGDFSFKVHEIEVFEIMN